VIRYINIKVWKLWMYEFGGVYQVVLFYENYYALDPNLDEGVLMYIIYMGLDLFSLLCLGHKKLQL